MYNKNMINDLNAFLQSVKGKYSKDQLADEVQMHFGLLKKRSVLYCDDFAIRFSYSKTDSPKFSNVVISLSTLIKYDSIPFIVCLTTPSENYLFLANTTFLTKISHSSKQLRIDNIRGSFLGNDIMYDFDGITNEPSNFERLFDIHEKTPFEVNLARLVEETKNIVAKGKRFAPTKEQKKCIMSSVDRTISFMQSKEFVQLNDDLNAKVQEVKEGIEIAASIDNINLRGRIIEYLITAEDEQKEKLMSCLREGSVLPEIFTADELGDYEQKFPNYVIQMDIKSKRMFSTSNPKGYNIDKLLSFLATENSVYLIYIVGIDENRKIHTQLCSVFNKQLLNGTRIQDHWAGRNSRGVSQYDGKAIECILSSFDPCFDYEKSKAFIEKLIEK